MSKSSTATERIPNPTPGAILLLEFLERMGLSRNALARAIRVPPRRINEIVSGRRAVTADADLRLLLERRRGIGRELASIRPRAA